MKTVIEMAREAGAIPIHKDYQQKALVGNENIERFAELVRADERNSWPAEMEAMERQVNILTDALAKARSNI
jgi:acyl carrier protein phosphodiesterase